ncbi:hypothetical protein LCGC14_0965780 [marine sediment metagenome]|uniref:Uncharacterized protein n=1 Tax=marine sediment metagenome TaxID=412755 RepID=A0A0F9NHK0_9ZZZZ
MESLGIVIAAGAFVALMTEDQTVRWVAAILILVSFVMMFAYVGF